MKRILSIFLLTALLLCSCSKDVPDVNNSKIIEINYDKISRRNNRNVLMNKYSYIREYIKYFNLDTNEDIPDWSISYCSDGNDNGNVMFIYGDNNRYFYNNTIYTELENDDYRVFIPYKSDYKTLIKETLKRENTLNYVYYKQQEGFKTPDGYAVSYWFIVTSDVLNEFIFWDIHVGDTIKVDYNLNSNFEILNYTYYIIDDPYGEPTYTKIMESSTEFDVPFKFPDFVYEKDTSPKVTLTVKENYKMPSEITEVYEIPVDTKIWGESSLIRSKTYTDYRFENEWNYENDIIKDSITLYTYPGKTTE